MYLSVNVRMYSYFICICMWIHIHTHSTFKHNVYTPPEKNTGKIFTKKWLKPFQNRLPDLVHKIHKLASLTGVNRRARSHSFGRTTRRACRGKVVTNLKQFELNNKTTSKSNKVTATQQQQLPHHRKKTKSGKNIMHKNNTKSYTICSWVQLIAVRIARFALSHSGTPCPYCCSCVCVFFANG